MICETCGAEVLNTESTGFCCGNNGIDKPHLIDIPNVPEALQALYETSKDLQKSSRKYNNIFSMSAIGATGYFETKKKCLTSFFMDTIEC